MPVFSFSRPFHLQFSQKLPNCSSKWMCIRVLRETEPRGSVCIHTDAYTYRHINTQTYRDYIHIHIIWSERQRETGRNFMKLAYKVVGQAQNLWGKLADYRFRWEFILLVWAWNLQSSSVTENVVRAVLGQNHFFEKPQSLLLIPSADRVKPTRIPQGNLLYSRSTDLNVNHI